jgi:hypothetical protein
MRLEDDPSYTRLYPMKSITRDFAVIATLVVVLFLGCVRKGTPQERHLADCDPIGARFEMVVEEQPPYSILFALPKTVPLDAQGRRVPLRTNWSPDLRGEIILKDDSGKRTRLEINSAKVKWCNWLERDHGVEAFILCSPSLKRGKSYDVEITFSQTVPPGSSLWLSGVPL